MSKGSTSDIVEREQYFNVTPCHRIEAKNYQINLICFYCFVSLLHHDLVDDLDDDVSKNIGLKCLVFWKDCDIVSR